MLRIVTVEDKVDTESIDTTQFFLNLAQNIKDREEDEMDYLSQISSVIDSEQE